MGLWARGLGLGGPSCPLPWGQHPAVQQDGHTSATHLSPVSALVPDAVWHRLAPGTRTWSPHLPFSPCSQDAPLTSGRGDPSVASRGSDAAAAWRAGFGGGPRGHHHSVSVSSPPPSGLLPGSRPPSAPQPPTPPCRLGRRPTVHPAVHTQPSRATGPAQPPRHLGTNARRQDPASCTQAWRGPAGEGPARHTLGPAGVLGHGHGLRAARGLFLLGKGPWAGPWALSGHSYGA